MTSPSVIKSSTAQRFEITDDAGVAVLSYHEGPHSIALIHTEVPPALEGRGYAGALARAALDYARAAGLKVSVLCPFVKSYIERHPEYRPLMRAPENPG